MNLITRYASLEIIFNFLLRYPYVRQPVERMKRERRGWQGCARGSAVSCWHYSWFPWWRRYLGCPFPPATVSSSSCLLSSTLVPSCLVFCRFYAGGWGYHPAHLARPDTEKEQPPGLSGRDRSFLAPYLYRPAHEHNAGTLSFCLSRAEKALPCLAFASAAIISR